MEKNHSVDQNQLLHYYFQLKNNNTTTLRGLFGCFGGCFGFRVAGGVCVFSGGGFAWLGFCLVYKQHFFSQDMKMFSHPLQSGTASGRSEFGRCIKLIDFDHQTPLFDFLQTGLTGKQTIFLCETP